MDKQLKILIVDDEAVVCTRLKPALEKDGYYVETYTDSTIAKKRLDRYGFDIVVTDIKMAEVDGIELLGFIRRKVEVSGKFKPRLDGKTLVQVQSFCLLNEKSENSAQD